MVTEDHAEAGKGVDREGLLEAIREEERRCAATGEQLTLQRFLSRTRLSYTAVRKFFKRWRSAMRAAGCKAPVTNRALEEGHLLADWAGVARKLGRAPGFREYWRMGLHHPTTISKVCGGRWSKVVERFRKFAEGKEEWRDVVAMLPPPGYRGPACRFGREPVSLRAPVRTGERIYGAPLDFKNLRHAPVNEMGVVCLFGAMAAELGFLIESIQSGFPDCEAKRCCGEGKWQLKRIEFEYESRNFLEHGHPAERCEMIVCWKHNWVECPANIEVIALSEKIEVLSVKC